MYNVKQQICIAFANLRSEYLNSSSDTLVLLNLNRGGGINLNLKMDLVCSPTDHTLRVFGVAMGNVMLLFTNSDNNGLNSMC